MNYYSTNNNNYLVSFKEAVIKGISEDSGLFMPTEIPPLGNSFLKNINQFSFNDIAFQTAKNFIGDEIPEADLYDIISKKLNFPAPIISLDKNKFVLELFHGPTLAFKDFGARFMAGVLSYFTKNENNGITILVATSGDTGSAVASGFYKAEGIKVVLLYPSGKVSKIQEHQLTTQGENITALEIDGTFDDCQKLVKQAFADKTLTQRRNLSSANSINIARLLPQSFYYLNAYAQLENKSKPLIFSVPSGNLGNLTGGLLAKEMGLPVHKFIAAVNSNDVVPNYLSSGVFTPKPSVQTLSNAMDVGNPSNFARIISLYENNLEWMRNILFSKSFSDEETKCAIKDVYSKYNYIIDPHGAVGFLALNDYLADSDEESNSIILETAHPAKFKDVVEEVIKNEIEVPERLEFFMKREKQSVKLSKNFEEFKSFLIESIYK